jgi:16S rRNA (cytidine1402-2'-O)-methyltransferase
MKASEGDERPTDWMGRAGLAEQDFPAGALYVVALPLGNAADITLRALWILSRVDAIAAEDTRVTRPLLERFGIGTPLVAAHQHNERTAADSLVSRLVAGERIALVTDAGTPAVSDPGAVVVRAVHAAGCRVIPVPGPSALTAAISAAGLLDPAFAFVGFLPTGIGERTQALEQLVRRGKPFVLYEAPHRIRALLALLAKHLEPEHRVIIARELTKKFETIGVHEASRLAALEVPERGEFVVLVDASATTTDAPVIEEATLRWLEALAAELPPARAASVVSKVTGAPRDVLYDHAIQLRRR